jgi:hypothetical protein
VKSRRRTEGTTHKKCTSSSATSQKELEGTELSACFRRGRRGCSLGYDAGGSAVPINENNRSKVPGDKGHLEAKQREKLNPHVKKIG